MVSTLACAEDSVARQRVYRRIGNSVVGSANALVRAMRTTGFTSNFSSCVVSSILSRGGLGALLSGKGPMVLSQKMCSDSKEEANKRTAMMFNCCVSNSATEFLVQSP